ncbi:hypothetical protein PSTG_01032 [Puccinia striiformis f. sp. tritici PST-78]|uniref:F-box domain-containing protein n=1 Tax=Puccinia striiformis f. sp. tritici PST-78 TaxID=1165861 RepID=A0A0L0W3C0_9BASI|nr:hypothetical protein PSTG_01032 [Puccinia striiformis f. sp. tritici PST-78]
MPNFSDLPTEALDRILQQVLHVSGYRWYSDDKDSKAKPAGELRLVCRQWSEWFYEHHLYRRLSFDSGARAMHFIIHELARSRRRPFLRPAACTDLTLQEVWSWGPSSSDQDKVTPATLEALIELFHDTIVDLDFTLVNFLSLPTSTIKALGRIKNLRTLSLGFDSRSIPDMVTDSSQQSSPKKPSYISFQHGPDFLRSLLMAVPGLEYLDLFWIRSSDVPDIPRSYLPSHLLPNITRLKFYFPPEDCPLDGIVSLVIALKSSLRMLTITHQPNMYTRRGNDTYHYFNGINKIRVNDHRLLPLFEALQNTLEGLSISSSRMLTTFTQLKFTKLRVLKVKSWDGCISRFLNLDMFSDAPIQLVYLKGREIDNHPPILDLDPLARLPKLRLVLFQPDYEVGFSLPESYTNACEDHGVEYSVDDLRLPDLMEL